MKKYTIKQWLKNALRYLGVSQEELWNKTGFYFTDVKTVEDLAEVLRLLDVMGYYVPNYIKNLEGVKR